MGVLDDRMDGWMVVHIGVEKSLIEDCQTLEFELIVRLMLLRFL